MRLGYEGKRKYFNPQGWRVHRTYEEDSRGHDGKTNGGDNANECNDRVMDCGVARARSDSCMEACGDEREVHVDATVLPGDARGKCFEHEGLRVNRGYQEECTGHDQNPIDGKKAGKQGAHQARL